MDTLPPQVRRIVLSEFARVLKPGGRLVLVDSLQHGELVQAFSMGWRPSPWSAPISHFAATAHTEN